MSEDNHSVSLDMLYSQLSKIDSGITELFKKRRLTKRQLTELMAGGDNVLTANILTSLQKLSTESAENGEDALEIWRSTFPTDIRQTGLKKVLVSGSESLRIWDQARALFGHDVPMSFENDPREALTLCADQPDCIVVVGWMTLAGSGQWWPVLNETRFQHLRISGVWPVSKDLPPYAAIVGHGPLNTPAGHATILIAHDDHHRVSRIFSEFDLKVFEFGRARSLVLFEIDGRLTDEDPRVKAAKVAGLDGLRVVGALPRYNRPES